MFHCLYLQMEHLEATNEIADFVVVFSHIPLGFSFVIPHNSYHALLVLQVTQFRKKETDLKLSKDKYIIPNASKKKK